MTHKANVTTPIRLGGGFYNLGVLNAQQLVALYPHSSMSNNVTYHFWSNLIQSLYLTNPNWYLFTQPVFVKECEGIKMYFQLGMYHTANETGLGLLGEDFINEFLVDLTVSQYAKQVIEYIHYTGYAHAVTNIQLNDEGDGTRSLVQSSNVIRISPDMDLDDYLMTLTSKKRNSAKKSLSISQGLTYSHVQHLNPTQVAWTLMHVVNNFGDSGAGEDNSYALEASMHQWTTLIGSPDTEMFMAFDSSTHLPVSVFAFTRRSPDSSVYDFSAFIQDKRSYNGAGTAMLMETAMLLSNRCMREVTILLNTAPSPGEDYDSYVSYKKNASNASIQVHSMLASEPGSELAPYYKNVFDSTKKVWV